MIALLFEWRRLESLVDGVIAFSSSCAALWRRVSRISALRWWAWVTSVAPTCAGGRHFSVSASHGGLPVGHVQQSFAGLAATKEFHSSGLCARSERQQRLRSWVDLGRSGLHLCRLRVFCQPLPIAAARAPVLLAWLRAGLRGQMIVISVGFHHCLPTELFHG